MSTLARKLRFGILGTGNIARQFADGVAHSHRSAVAGVGSRSRDSALGFAANRNIPGIHGSYDELLSDPNVDAIYNSLPNHLHHEWTIKALAQGKHVLCEKPFAMDLAQSQEMFDAARKHGKLLVEAFMYRSHPLTRAVHRAVQSGVIGALQLIRTSFCYRTTRVAGNIRFDRSMGGGGLMDVGCYCINFSRLFGDGEPTAVHASAHMHETGVDDRLVATLAFPNGVLASFTCGMTVQADNTAYLCGSDGYIEVPFPWKPPPQNAIYHVSQSIPPRQDLAGKPAAPASPPRQTHSVDANNSLYGCEADDFAAAVLDGAAPSLTRVDTLGNMRILDEIRRQIGLSF